MELIETTFSDAPRVDREAGVIRDVKVLGRESKNGRSYSDNALRDAARIYEGVKVRFDHPPKNEPGKERQFVDSFGRLERLRLAEDGVYGDLSFKKSHPYADLVCESAERFARDFGLSHNAEGTVTQKNGKTIVESITRARGVDVVDSPASTQGIFESESASCSIVLNETFELTEHDKQLGKMAAMEAADGHNPASWVADEAKWEKAKAAADKGGYEGDTYWAVVSHIYQQMGGSVKSKESVDEPSPAQLVEQDSMDMPTGMTPADHEKKLKAGLEKMMMAIFRDDSIDTAMTVKKIAQSLKHYDKLLSLGTPGDGSTPMPAEPMKESTNPTGTGVTEMAEANKQTETPVAESKPGTVDLGDATMNESQFRQLLESVVNENNQLKAELAKERTQRSQMEREIKARRLLESKGRESSPGTEEGRRNVETLLKIESESIWPTLIDSWPAKSDKRRPARTGSVMEGPSRPYHSPLDVHDGKSLVAALFE